MADVQEAFIRFMFDLGRGVDMDGSDKNDRGIDLLMISDNGKRDWAGIPCMCRIARRAQLGEGAHVT